MFQLPDSWISGDEYTTAFTQAKYIGCRSVSDLNQLVSNDGIRELIRVNEAQHEKEYGQIADEICRRGARAVMLAGPSSSGKTTSGSRVATHLQVLGLEPILLSLDDYYIDRELIPLEPDGRQDFEHIDTIDTQLFAMQFSKLLQGEAVTLPYFDFLTGKRQWRSHPLQLSERSVIIVEGLHALNPALLPQKLDQKMVFRLYVQPFASLELDEDHPISGRFLRLMRRIIRDHRTRGASVQQTLSMWDSVCGGEERWIYPFREMSDWIFNSGTLYEPAVLKKHILPLLNQVLPEDPYYPQVQAIVKILDIIKTAEVDDEIPPTSLIREFIGGSAFYK